MNLTERRIEEFIAALKEMGGSSGNGSLRQALVGWDEEFYWKVQGHLIGEGRLAAGHWAGQRGFSSVNRN
jgi:hypothetical protein